MRGGGWTALFYGRYGRQRPVWEYAGQCHGIRGEAAGWADAPDPALCGSGKTVPAHLHGKLLHGTHPVQEGDAGHHEKR